NDLFLGDAASRAIVAPSAAIALGSSLGFVAMGAWATLDGADVSTLTGVTGFAGLTAMPGPVSDVVDADLRLRATAPCAAVGGGEISVIMATTDFTGAPRTSALPLACPGYSLGAYEAD